MRIIVYLTEQEWQALRDSAERNLRGLREQARYLIIKGLAAEIAAQVAAPQPAQPAEVVNA